MQELRTLNQPNPQAVLEKLAKSGANHAIISVIPIHHLTNNNTHLDNPQEILEDFGRIFVSALTTNNNRPI